jgi:hypothetical protein
MFFLVLVAAVFLSGCVAGYDQYGRPVVGFPEPVVVTPVGGYGIVPPWSSPYNSWYYWDSMHGGYCQVYAPCGWVPPWAGWYPYLPYGYSPVARVYTRVENNTIVVDRVQGRGINSRSFEKNFQRTFGRPHFNAGAVHQGRQGQGRRVTAPAGQSHSGSPANFRGRHPGSPSLGRGQGPFMNHGQGQGRHMSPNAGHRQNFREFPWRQFPAAAPRRQGRGQGNGGHGSGGGGGHRGPW